MNNIFEHFFDGETIYFFKFELINLKFYPKILNVGIYQQPNDCFFFVIVQFFMIKICKNIFFSIQIL